ncbi:MAG: ABC transporter ATP-binding protein [Opitutales bacterium]
MISIQVQQLTKRFGNVVALQGLDLAIAPGELFFLLGPSGCGKTTLLRALAGFHVPEEGRILFDGEDVTRLEPHKRNTGMMFQSYALWPHMTVAETVAFGLEQRQVPAEERRQRVAEALASVHMSDYAGRSPNQLSGGQQQRVALARALVIRPRCLLLDEPLSNLDAKLRLEMRGEIRRVCQEFKLTTVYVTHDQKEALSIADRMAILDRGRIMQVGTPREVYRYPTSRLVADFIGETDFLPGRVAALSADEVVVETAVGRFQGVIGNLARRPVVGGEVTLSIRPECWELHDTAPSGNAVRGTIGECVYLGEVAQYGFHTPEGVKLRIFERNPRHLDSVRRGELHARVAPEDVVVLTE